MNQIKTWKTVQKVSRYTLHRKWYLANTIVIRDIYVFDENRCNTRKQDELEKMETDKIIASRFVFH